METFALNSFSLNMCVFTVCVCIQTFRGSKALTSPQWSSMALHFPEAGALAEPGSLYF